MCPAFRRQRPVVIRSQKGRRGKVVCQKHVKVRGNTLLQMQIVINNIINKFSYVTINSTINIGLTWWEC
ncbi:hypothetical protein EB837_01385 [Kluyvera ascorbata]|uniref:Uncharacterized protein n=1 Tax=Kluyvera ascorbata TaxID=51288 RepID=A0A3N2SFQ9_9ENTR|nr:hypothetical protein EB837_01385 [Kluyvera ascorbata]